MDRPAARLFARSVEAARAQLDAARRLDRQALDAATARRQDLLFELGVVAPSAADLAADPEAARLLRELRALDRRLDRVLGTVAGALREILPRGAPAVYAANGRLRGGAR